MKSSPLVVLGSGISLAASGLCSGIDLGTTGFRGVYRSGRFADHRAGWGYFDPKINRHTGQPHEHKREIARRLRQQARAAQ